MKKIVLVLIIATYMISCKKEGYTNASAVNYDSKAEKDDGSCKLAKDYVFGNYKSNCSSQNNSYIISFHCANSEAEGQFNLIFDDVPSFMGNEGDSMLYINISKNFSINLSSVIEHGTPPNDIIFYYLGTGSFSNNRITMSLTETITHFPSPSVNYDMIIDATKQ